jgi:hypothetical protein
MKYCHWHRRKDLGDGTFKEVVKGLGLDPNFLLARMENRRQKTVEVILDDVSMGLFEIDLSKTAIGGSAKLNFRKIKE